MSNSFSKDFPLEKIHLHYMSLTLQLVLLVVLIVIFALFSALAVADRVLDCSAFGVNATNLSASTMQSWSARLHACFKANPYDTSQLPAPDEALPITLYYDFTIVNLLSFKEAILKARLKSGRNC